MIIHANARNGTASGGWLSRLPFSLTTAAVPFLFLVCMLAVHAGAPARATGPEAPRLTYNTRVSLPYGAWVDRPTSELVARALARTEIVRQAEQSVAPLTVVRLGLDAAESLPALTFMALRPLLSMPPDDGRQVILEADMFVPRAALPEIVQAQIGKSDELDVRTDMLERGRLAAQEAMTLVQRQSNEPVPEDGARERLAYLARQLHALERLDEMLERFGNEWQPAEEAAEALREALGQDPDSALLQLGLAETLLRLDRAHEAIDAASRALQLDPELARGYYVRGLAQLRVNLVSLAVADLSQAISRRQDRASWWRARAAARLVHHDYDAMCADLYTACSLGDCGGLAEVRNRDLCLQD